MGPSARSLYPVVGLAAVGQTFADLGAAVDIGAGIEAALTELSQAKPAVELA
jgi:ribosomal protein S12 methylthiotransferase accessory factor YcaO